MPMARGADATQPATLSSRDDSRQTRYAMDTFRDAMQAAAAAVEHRNGPTQQTHHAHGGALVGDLLNHEDRTADAKVEAFRETRDLVRRMERGDALAASSVTLNIIRLDAGGMLPKGTRAVAKALGFRADNGAVRFIKVAKAANAGCLPIIVPLKVNGETPPPRRYRDWPEAVGAQGITACYNAAREALSESSALPTHRSAFGKAVHSRVAFLRHLMPFGDVKMVLASLLDGRQYSEEDVAGLYTGPNPDLPMERGESWDDVLADMVASAGATTEDEDSDPGDEVSADDIAERDARKASARKARK